MEEGGIFRLYRIMLLHTSCEPNDDDEVRKEGKEKKKEKLSVHNP